MPERELRGIRLRDQEGDKPEGTYAIEAYCTNCEWEGEAHIPKGTSVPRGAPLERLARCENCGCETLERYAQSDEEDDNVSEAVAEEAEVNEDLGELHRRLAELTREVEVPRRPTPVMPSPVMPVPTPPPPWPRGQPYGPNMPLPAPGQPYRPSTTDGTWEYRNDGTRVWCASSFKPDVVNRNGDSFGAGALNDALAGVQAASEETANNARMPRDMHGGYAMEMPNYDVPG